MGGMIMQRPLNAGFADLRERERLHSEDTSRPDLKRFYSSPTALTSLPANGTESGVSNTRFLQANSPAGDIPMQDDLDQKTMTPSSPVGSENDGDQEMLKQLATNPITETQLINEVRMIYAALVMVERKCIEADRNLTERKAELSGSEWQSLIALHRSLLCEHHDFFLASQHHSASDVLKCLAERYAMPARLWRYGIHSFLELLRQNLPDSLEYMLSFIYLAYPMMALLKESVASFRETWIECLGDLARYRMAIEESDLGDREIWAGISRDWYNHDADLSPDVGRIQHHLAVLSRPDGLLQLFYYSKALVTVSPFPNARESIALLFNPYEGQEMTQNDAATSFIATHGILFNQGPEEKFVASANRFLSLLRKEVRTLGQDGQQGVYMMSSNFAAIFQYGQPESAMALEFTQVSEKQGDMQETYKFALEWTSISSPDNQTISSFSQDSFFPSLPSPPTALQGSCLTFHTLAVFLDQTEDPFIRPGLLYPGVHTGLAFIWCLALHPTAMQQLETMIPWLPIAKFLNSLCNTNTNFSTIENNEFPLHDYPFMQQLREDFHIRGQLWSQLYYPGNFFDNAPCEDNRPPLEHPDTVIPRRHRCLWLGVRLATVCASHFYTNEFLTTR